MSTLPSLCQNDSINDTNVPTPPSLDVDRAFLPPTVHVGMKIKILSLRRIVILWSFLGHFEPKIESGEPPESLGATRYFHPRQGRADVVELVDVLVG